jgi:hypothetical protein
VTAYPIELHSSETVTLRGVRRITWHVRQVDAWVSASDVPGAQLADQERKPGVVWARQLLLQLPVGAELMCVESRPKPVVARDPMTYLSREVRNVARDVRRSYFRVDERGKLVRCTR